MNDRGAALACAAERLVGSPFRLHGRDATTGLDCVGLCVAALKAVGRTVHVPITYSFRNTCLGDLDASAASAGLAPADDTIRAGDILVVQLSAVQFHLMIAAADGWFVHAHAGLRRVTRSPGPNIHPVIAHWRLAGFS